MAEDDAARPKSEAPRADEPDEGRDGTAAQDGSAGGETPAAEVERLRAEVAGLKDRWLRERAELENFKRRQSREERQPEPDLHMQASSPGVIQLECGRDATRPVTPSW